MLINRAHIYIFGIPNHHRLMPCTWFLGVKRLPAEKVLKHTVGSILSEGRVLRKVNVTPFVCKCMYPKRPSLTLVTENLDLGTDGTQRDKIRRLEEK